MSRLQDKVAMITGISSGIGRAAAQLFCEQGAKGAIVFGMDRNTAAAEAWAAELIAQDYQFTFYAADLSIAADCAFLAADAPALMRGAAIVVDGVDGAKTIL